MDESADWLPLSVVERFTYCPRQAYLFHVEGELSDNLFTVEGTLLHRRATEGDDESRPGVRICRALWLRSDRLRVLGVADVVEFHGDRAVPVEYKRGGTKNRACERHQLCLQAICLEEMTGRDIPEGIIFHGATRRRERVQFAAELRSSTEELLAQVRSSFGSEQAPLAARNKGCQSCSLRDACLPGVTEGTRSALDWTHGRLGL